MSEQENSLEVLKEGREVANTVFGAETLVDLQQMVSDSIEHQKKVNPIFQEVASKVLDIFNNDKELSTIEAKDLFKLLEITNKAQIQPIVELTKLVQAVSSLYDKRDKDREIESLKELSKELVEGFKHQADVSSVSTIEDLIK